MQSPTHWKQTNVCSATPQTLGRTPKGADSSRGRSRHLLETAFSEALLRTLPRTLFECKTHSRPPSQKILLRTPSPLPRTFSEPFLERCVAVRPLTSVHPIIWVLQEDYFCIFQTCLALKRAFQPGAKYVFLSIFGGKGAVPGAVPLPEE